MDRSGVMTENGNDSVTVLVEPDAGKLERFAADELCRYLAVLFQVDVKPVSETAIAASVVFRIGTTGRDLIRAVTSPPVLSDQGMMLRSVELDGRLHVIVSGGSEKAVLWAVYELVQRWGVRFLLHEDVLPEPRERNINRPVPPDMDIVMEPSLRLRTWRVVNSLAFGPISWGIEDYRRVLGQLAKLRFNRILVSIWSFQPFLDPICGGIQRQKAHLWFGYRYPITDDMIGRDLFENRDEFWNPDLPLGASYDELAAAGQQHIRSIMECAHGLGMECVLSLNPLEYPPEFAPLLPGNEKVEQLGSMAVVPGADVKLDDPALVNLASCVIQTAREIYAETDLIGLAMPEWRQWTGQYEHAWDLLGAEHEINRECSLDDVLSSAERRSTETDYMGANSDRAVNEAKGDIVTLAFYDQLLKDGGPLRDVIDTGKRLMYCHVAEDLFPVLDRVLPEGSELLNFVDYTPARIVKRKDVLKRIPSESIPCSLIFTLHDDNVGFLPQSEGEQLEILLKEIAASGWAGFSTRYWLTGDHDPCVNYLARGAWHSGTSRTDVYTDQIKHICGHGAAKHLLPALEALETATHILEMDELGVAFPTPSLFMKHWKTGPLSPALRKARRLYQQAQDEVSGAYYSAEKGTAARRYTSYWMNRLEFGFTYIDAIEALRGAARAEEKGDTLGTVRQAKMALGTLNRAMEALTRSIKDRSDLGTLAILNTFAYRPLSARIASISRKSDASSQASSQ